MTRQTSRRDSRPSQPKTLEVGHSTWIPAPAGWVRVDGNKRTVGNSLGEALRWNQGPGVILLGFWWSATVWPSWG